MKLSSGASACAMCRIWSVRCTTMVSSIGAFAPALQIDTVKAFYAQLSCNGRYVLTNKHISRKYLETFIMTLLYFSHKSSPLICSFSFNWKNNHLEALTRFSRVRQIRRLVITKVSARDRRKGPTPRNRHNSRVSLARSAAAVARSQGAPNRGKFAKLQPRKWILPASGQFFAPCAPPLAAKWGLLLRYSPRVRMRDTPAEYSRAR